MEEERKIRVLMAKPGLDGHDRGVRIVSKALTDDGMEVIYSGLQQTPEAIVNAAIQEDVDVIGLSILSGSPKYFCLRIVELLEQNKVEDMLVLCGGIVPDDDIPSIKEAGIAGVFVPGSSLKSIANFIRDRVNPDRVKVREHKAEK
jgi:methylmalonyl-CoA mutase C-terminal domain/subunit